MGAYTMKVLNIRTTQGRSMDVVMTFPKTGDGPFPAVVCIGGNGSNMYTPYTNDKPWGDYTPTSDTGDKLYKGFGQELAKNGYVTISTLVSQHEVYEPGRTLMGERLWDVMRCVDYLQSLPQVDKATWAAVDCRSAER